MWLIKFITGVIYSVPKIEHVIYGKSCCKKEKMAVIVGDD